MVDQLSSFADEVTRVAREVGTEGQLGGQAEVKGVSGTWRDLTENVNQLANNLTEPGAQHRPGHHRGGQRRPDAEDHGRRPRRDPRAQATRSTRWSTSSRPSPTRSRASRARWAPRASSAARPRSRACRGTWRGLTENVNQLAGEPHHAGARDRRRVRRRDPGRPDAADHGRGLRRGRRAQGPRQPDDRQPARHDAANAEQDWLKTNLARISGLMQGQRDLQTGLAADHVRDLAAGQRPARRVLPGSTQRRRRGRRRAAPHRLLRLQAAQEPLQQFQLRRGPRRPGGARDARASSSPTRPTDYVKVTSGPRRGARRSTSMVLPILFEEQVLAVIELASLNPFAEVDLTFLEQLSETIGVVLNDDHRQQAHRGAARGVSSGSRRSCSRSRRSCRPSRTSSSAPTPSSRSRRSRCAPPRSCCRPSRRSCARPTRSCRRRRRCSPSRTATSRSRTPRSSARACALEEQRRAARARPRSTRASSWPT